jgi:pimeloyl-ACP methyl ester carboxylesterase
MVKTEQIELEMPWGVVKGQIFGNKVNTRPILCLHGYLDNSNSFKPLAPFLCESNQYHLICIDLPGQGLSSKIADPMLYSLKTFIFCIRKIILDLDLKDFIFMGHSFGCTLGLMVRP